MHFFLLRLRFLLSQMGSTGLNGSVHIMRHGTTSPAATQAIISKNKSYSEIAQCERALNNSKNNTFWECVNFIFELVLLVHYFFNMCFFLNWSCLYFIVKKRFVRKGVDCSVYLCFPGTLRKFTPIIVQLNINYRSILNLDWLVFISTQNGKRRFI